MNSRCWINGETATYIAADDRGLQYGDGLFETMSVRAGRITLLDAHLQRLESGCQRLRFAPPPLQTVRQHLNAIAHSQDRAILKLIVTRGRGGRGYRPPVDAQPNWIVTLHDWPTYPGRWWHDGIRLRVCETVLGANPAFAGLKHLNRLEQVMARAEWQDADDIQEGLMLDAGGAVIEGTMTNVFAVGTDGTFITPRLDSCGVAGVMRHYLIERAGRDGVPVQVGRMTLDDIHNAKELFVCNSVIGVWPVRRVDQHEFPVGEMTRTMQGWAEQA